MGRITALYVVAAASAIGCYAAVNYGHINIDSERRAKWEAIICQHAGRILAAAEPYLQKAFPPAIQEKLRECREILERAGHSGNEPASLRPQEIPPPGLQAAEAPQYPFNQRDGPSNIVLAMPASGSSHPIIVAASLIKVVERLTQPSTHDEELEKALLLDLEALGGAGQLLHLLVLRYDVPETDPQAAEIRALVVSLLTSWLRSYLEDFVGDVYYQLTDFVSTKVTVRNPGAASALQDLIAVLATRRTEKISRPVRMQSKPRTLTAPAMVVGRLLSEAMPLAAFADQITLVDAQLFRPIEPREFLLVGAPDGDKERRAKNLLRCLDSAQAFKGFVMTSMVVPEKAKDRTALLKVWIQLAELLYGQGNLQATIAIVSALNSAPVLRLKKTWKGLSQRRHDILTQLSGLTLSDGQWRAYRDALDIAKVAAVPNIEWHVEELAGAVGRRTARADGLLDLAGTRDIVAKVQAMTALQQRSVYTYAPDNELQDLYEFLQTCSFDLPTVSDLSCTREPTVKE